MILLERTSSSHPDFIKLVALLDAYLAQVDGDEHHFYNQFNGITTLQHCLVIYDDNVAVGCGAIKKFESTSFEIKRMYVHHTARGKGYAIQLVNALEEWAQELGATHTVLETGKRMQDAVQLYNKLGYTSIANYGQYKGVANSLCFMKQLKS